MLRVGVLYSHEAVTPDWLATSHSSHTLQRIYIDLAVYDGELVTCVEDPVALRSGDCGDTS
jgi:hypothetical protein